ncbi:MAG: hypothetical protein COU29_01730 [Candidatus Magasanikbacteria bacterium CG10_big_fil_rev_8_21_14_0_10_36_32]|uniref:DUF5671 domain-containing protein n=1 Tax=Candidatus Magasanikbacteria bacterium CG10_big_fil_rev_8_21_14_0_10_36_32 TaxID=1974646 RepID=A0A2M6W6S0_9BACT|nr:MAG: hypothetical protein COU29_01730 [Candidatus Magasanikbacteria bacterium CG10_big_fil_rev_8_21_14_0_10_36_32]
MENQTAPASAKIIIIKNIYFYLVSFVALMMVVFALANLINIALKTWVFTNADNFYYGPISTECGILVKSTDSAENATTRQMTPEECIKQDETNRQREKDSQASQKQRDAVRDISLIVVGIPLFILHWRALRKKENV